MCRKKLLPPPWWFRLLIYLGMAFTGIVLVKFAVS